MTATPPITPPTMAPMGAPDFFFVVVVSSGESPLADEVLDGVGAVILLPVFVAVGEGKV
jgi:hypothetical protein